MEEVQIKVFDSGIQAGLGFEARGIEFPAFHEDALFFLVGDGFTCSDANPDAAAEAYWREFGGLHFYYGDVSFRKGDFVHLHHRLRKDVAFTAHTGKILLEFIRKVETGRFSIVIGTDEQIAGFAGVHDVIGKGTDGLTELFRGIDGDGALGAFVLSILKEREYGCLVEHIDSFLLRS